MRKVTYSMGMTLDGFIQDAHGDFSWGDPEPAVFALSMEEIQDVGVHLLGRRLYETMRYWETADPATFDAMEREWAALWNPLPKVVFSRTLTEVEGQATRLATGTLAEEIARLRAEPGEGDIAIGGAELAAQAAAADLIDEYLVRVFPVLVGGGTPFFARDGQRRRLELVETRTFPSGVVHLRHRVVR
jgi:dihydrofolate reductase